MCVKHNVVFYCGSSTTVVVLVAPGLTPVRAGHRTGAQRPHNDMHFNLAIKTKQPAFMTWDMQFFCGFLRHQYTFSTQSL